MRRRSVDVASPRLHAKVLVVVLSAYLPSVFRLRRADLPLYRARKAPCRYKKKKGGRREGKRRAIEVGRRGQARAGKLAG